MKTGGAVLTILDIFVLLRGDLSHGAYPLRLQACQYTYSVAGSWHCSC
jgi:hypothetical protein